MAPERGRANEAVVGLLADRLGVPRTSVSVVAGRASRDKVVELRGLGPGEAQRRLERASGTGFILSPRQSDR